MSHEILSFNFEQLSLRVELGRVEESEKYTSGGPRELVSEGVVGRVRSGKTTTVRDKSGDLSSASKSVSSESADREKVESEK